MKKNGFSKGLIGTGLISAIAASLCCITPLLALIAGSSGLASSFSWMEPFRPYLIGLTILVLGFAWYQKLKPSTSDDIVCDCETDEKPSFWQTKSFLLIVTVFAVLMMLFPYYGHVFYKTNKQESAIIQQDHIKQITLKVDGMTCASCQAHVQHAALSLPGVTEADVLLDQGLAHIKFDKSRVDTSQIIQAINQSGYKVSGIINVQERNSAPAFIPEAPGCCRKKH